MLEVNSREELLAMFRKAGKNKYHAQKVHYAGFVFDSRMEAARYVQLRDMERKKEIRELQVHVPFVVWESKLKTKVIKYVPDFVYERNMLTIIEDVKGDETDVFKMKAKMFKDKYPKYEFTLVKLDSKTVNVLLAAIGA